VENFSLITSGCEVGDVEAGSGLPVEVGEVWEHAADTKETVKIITNIAINFLINFLPKYYVILISVMPFYLLL
jgi:hypothetical protein